MHKFHSNASEKNEFDALNFYNHRWPAIIRIIAIICFLIVIAMLTARVGRIPAASAGDEVWFSEAAYWLLQEGTLRRDIHQDSIGSSVRDFLPPIPSIAQAFAFAIGGMNAFTISIAPTAALIILLIAFLFAIRRATDFTTIAPILAFSFLFVPDALLIAVQPRFNVYVALFTAAALLSATSCMIIFSRPDKIKNEALPLVASGFFITLSIISYYQFVVVGALLGIAILLLPSSYHWQKRLLYFTLGAAVPASLFALWIGGDFRLFFYQNIASSGGYGFTHRLVNLWPSTDRIYLEATVSTTLSIIFVLFARHSSSRPDINPFLISLFGATLVSSMLAVIAFPGMILISSILTAFIGLVAFSIAKNKKGHLYRISATALFLMSFSGVVMTTLYSAKGIIEKNRDYSALARDLVESANISGIALIDQPGWLALRPYFDAGDMLHLTVLTPDAAQLHTSRILSTTDASEVSMIAVRPGLLEEFREAHALVASFLDREDVEGPIAVGPGYPNNMVVFRVRHKDNQLEQPQLH